jgi:flagellar motor switch protein FliN
MSAISEVVNQMIGSAATTISSMMNKRIGISQPKAFLMSFKKENSHKNFNGSQKIVKITLKIIVEDKMESDIIQIIPVSFAKELVESLVNSGEDMKKGQIKVETGITTHSIQNMPFEGDDYDFALKPEGHSDDYNKSNNGMYDESHKKNVSVQPAQFQAFEEGRFPIEKGNISLIMDVPLQVTVELGRTQKLIRDILELGSGSVIELEKLAGEPVDILVNNKAIAKGEVVVIDESFGVRVTDIIDPSKRL